MGVNRVYVTHDGGHSWSLARLPVRHIDAGPTFTDPNHGWFFARKELYATSDGGISWSSFAPNLSLAGSTPEFVGPTDGWAFSRDPDQPFLLRTEDGGKTWTVLSPTVVK